MVMNWLVPVLIVKTGEVKMACGFESKLTTVFCLSSTYMLLSTITLAEEAFWVLLVIFSMNLVYKLVLCEC